MEMKDKFIIKYVGGVARFNGSTSKPYGWVMLDIALPGKAVSVYLYLMNYNALRTMGCWVKTGLEKWGLCLHQCISA